MRGAETQRTLVLIEPPVSPVTSPRIPTDILARDRLGLVKHDDDHGRFNLPEQGGIVCRRGGDQVRAGIRPQVSVVRRERTNWQARWRVGCTCNYPFELPV